MSEHEHLIRPTSPDGGTMLPELPEGAIAPKTVDGKRLAGERRYMALVAAELGDEKVTAIANKIVKDAQGGGQGHER